MLRGVTSARGTRCGGGSYGSNAAVGPGRCGRWGLRREIAEEEEARGGGLPARRQGVPGTSSSSSRRRRPLRTWAGGRITRLGPRLHVGSTAWASKDRGAGPGSAYVAGGLLAGPRRWASCSWLLVLLLLSLQ